VVLRDLDFPLFGKTGTTTGPTNVWFVGGSPDIVAGVYMGYDQPRSLGGYAQGGTYAAPIFKQFVKESRDRWSGHPFTAPEGIRMVRIDRQSGRRVFGDWPGTDPKAATIWEAFKPDTEPRRGGGLQDDIDSMRDLIISQLKRREQGAATGAAAGEGKSGPPENFVEEQGGLY
jgi:penicillin-binding protein 1A